MKHKIFLIILAVGLILSLSLNLTVIYLLVSVRSDVHGSVVSTREGLEIITAESIEMEVQVDQLLPLDIIVPINEIISFPIDLVFPLYTVVNTTINFPIVGPQQVSVPIEADIPVNTIITIPVKMDLPISTEYHLQAVIPVKLSLPPETIDSMKKTLEDIEIRLR
jgi:hypothetical protein